jgi:hypothetical protein
MLENIFGFNIVNTENIIEQSKKWEKYYMKKFAEYCKYYGKK